jgi:voltage-gated potassium channel Kch
MVYFSATTITTVGFGDIVPLSSLARLVVGIEAVTGWVLAGLFLNAIAWRASRALGANPA